MSSEWNTAVERVLAMTQRDEITWIKSSVAREDVVGNAYETIVLGRRVLVWEYSFRRYTDEDMWTLDNEVAIEFVDPLGVCEWRWPETPARWKLLDAVRAQLANAKGFLRALLQN